MSFLNYQRLGEFGYQRQPIRVDLVQGVNVHAIVGRLTATVDIAAGGGNSGTVITEGVQRLIQSLRIRHDGDDRVGLVSGRQLYQLTRCARWDVVAATNLATGDVQTTNIAFDFEIPIESPWLDDPVMTVWPAKLPVRQELAAYIQFATDTNAGAGSDLGTGVLVDGGDRVITFTDFNLELVQVYSTGEIMPWYLARWTPDVTRTFDAATNQLPYLLAGGRRIQLSLFRFLSDDFQDATQALCNNLSLVSGMGALRYLDQLDFVMAQRFDLGDFPAAATIGQNGTLVHLLCDNGWLGSALDPRPLNQPQYQFNVNTPANPPGIVDILLGELDVYPGYTAMSV